MATEHVSSSVPPPSYGSRRAWACGEAQPGRNVALAADLAGSLSGTRAANLRSPHQRDTMDKRAFLYSSVLILASSLLAMAPRGAWAQEWPSKPIRIIVSFAPGGLTDTIARALQPALQESLGQPIVIENRPGAGGTVAEAALVRSPADGYTVLLSADSVPANPHLIPRLPYETFKDLAPVSLLARIPLVMLASNNVPVNTLRDFVAQARSGAKWSYGSPGVGTSNHLYFEVFKDLTGIDLPHIPYQGGGPAMVGLLGGNIQAMLISSTLAVPQALAGKVRALAVTGDKRLAQLSNVPTFAEAGFADFNPHQWTGVFVRAGTPPSIVEGIHNAFARASKSATVRTRLAELNAEPVVSSAADFETFLRRESQVLGQLIKNRGITAQ